MRKTRILMNNLVYLGFSKLELSKILVYEFWYDFVKPKYSKKTKFCSMDTDNLIMYIKEDDLYKGIAEDVETRLDTSNYELDRPLTKRKNTKVIGLMKGKLGWEIMKNLLD